MDTEDYGKDLATVQNLNHKHQLIDADVKAHEDRIKDLNEQADAFIESGMWDTESIKDKKQSINERYERYTVVGVSLMVAAPKVSNSIHLFVNKAHLLKAVGCFV